MSSEVVHPILDSIRGEGGGKVVPADDAARLIRDGDTIATSGFVGIGFAEGIARALEQRFLTARKRRPERCRRTARSDIGPYRRTGRRQASSRNSSTPISA